MRMQHFVPFACALALLRSPAVSDDMVRVKGSDTIGGRAMPEIAEAYRKSKGDVLIEVGALGSSTAFVGLFDGSADVGASSRPINEKEQATAKQLGLKLQELVIGYDGVAVVVHPDNPVKELTIAQVSALFSGKAKSWKKVGGRDESVRVISRPSYSGTHVFFKEKALRRGDPKGPEEFAPEAEFLEENGAILEAVAKDPRAVSYVGLGWLRPTVKAVPILSGSIPVAPTADSVRTGKYPLYRPLLMYVPASARREAVSFVRFVLSQEGAAVMARNGFVPPDTSTIPAVFAQAPEPAAVVAGGAGPRSVGPSDAMRAEPAPAPLSASAPAAPKRREVVRVLFASGSAGPRPEAERDLEAVAARLKEGGWSALVTGHADSSGPVAVNGRIALARAHAVARRLLAKGVKPELLAVEGQGTESPTASNESTVGRSQNRRVDIELVAK